MKLAPLAVAALASVACRSETAAPQVQTEVRRRADTVRFVAPAVAHRCEGGRGLLVEAEGLNSGVLVWLRGADSIAGPFPVIGVRDTVTARGAVAAVRYAARAVPYTLSLDSGTVTAADSGGALRLHVVGSGLDASTGSRPWIEATFHGLRPPRDSVPCVRAP